MSSQEPPYQISIVEERINKLMERRELRLEVVSQASPRRDLLRKALATSLKVPVENVYVRNVISSYGSRVSMCTAHVYLDGARGKAIEPKHIQMRNLSREERKQASAPAST
ncbi:MAG: 30S ribosomal protein S24e [Candidatus Verstraetearchaeota archaeon]|nr:30S ribosomal protein S24e [Candidatus Verstraetearchaeota archaeon]